MPLWRFVLFSTIGALAWNSLLVGAGYLLAENYELVEVWLDPGTNLVLGMIVLLYFYRLATWRPTRAQ